MENFSIKSDNIRTNYNKVIERIGKAARAVGRDPEDIRLVVVTKTQPVDVIKSVIGAGATDLGENYVEEAIPKIIALEGKRELTWHMIGHIQSRKAQNVCEHFQYIHSLDSLKLADKLSRYAIDLSKSMNLWMEFNISGEESKSGWNIAKSENWKNLVPEIEQIFALPRLNILGLMTLPPYSLNPEDSRPYYQQLQRFQRYIIERLNITGFKELSIGMSLDFEVAIQEGSTCVRIGQAILGPRI